MCRGVTASKIKIVPPFEKKKKKEHKNKTRKSISTRLRALKERNYEAQVRKKNYSSYRWHYDIVIENIIITLIHIFGKNDMCLCRDLIGLLKSKFF